MCRALCALILSGPLAYQLTGLWRLLLGFKLGHVVPVLGAKCKDKQPWYDFMYILPAECAKNAQGNARLQNTHPSRLGVSKKGGGLVQPPPLDLNSSNPLFRDVHNSAASSPIPGSGFTSPARPPRTRRVEQAYQRALITEVGVFSPLRALSQ